MKLSIIKEDEDANEMKEKIANFANSQNAVNAADLASNHPFHRKLEEISRRVIMPAGERVIPSKWYYERARGQYQTEKRKKRTLARLKILNWNIQNLNYSTKLIWPNLKTLGE